MNKISFFSVSVIMFTLSACGSLNTGNDTSMSGTMVGRQNGNAVAKTTNSAANAGTNVFGSLLQNATSGANLGNILTSVIGLDKVAKKYLVGTWKYKQPGCAFTSQSALTAAGGEVVSATVKEKLDTYYKKFGFKSNNTTFVFAKDGTFQTVLLGKQFSGNYTFEQTTQAITLHFSILGVPAYSLQGFVKKNVDGMALLFESKKILTVLQTLGALSGNSTVSNITRLTQNYDGVRIGFDLVR